MRQPILILLFIFCTGTVHAQYKIVKLDVDSAKIYLRFFYKVRSSDEIVNDSVTVVCRRIDSDHFFLDKYLHHKKTWTKKYELEVAKDSMRITTRTRDSKGKSKFIYTKEQYFNAIELK